MKTSIILVALSICSVSIYAQLQFGNKQLITNVTAGTSVSAADIDGDGDNDVIAAGDNTYIVWFENTDGLGNFSSSNIITDSANTVMSLVAIDIDGDTDIDILSANKQDSVVAWYENDGTGNFISQHNITDSAYYVQSVYAVDIDGDYDLDVISCGDHKIVWYENIDGYGNFGYQNYIIDTLDSPGSIFAVDFDNDADIDIVTASYGDSLVAWFENTDGYGNFSPINIISDTVLNVMTVYACDMDNDGDNDVVSASVDIISHKNDGLGNFNQHDIISQTMLGGQSVYACDMDDDGDNDVISAELSALMYHQNNLGSFNTQYIATSGVDGLFSVYASDLDGDGDNDVLCASMFNISWFKNLGLNGIEQIGDNYNIDIYPNPTTDHAYLTAESLIKYDIINQLGEVVESVDSNNSIDLTNKSSGIYHIRIVLENQIVFRKLLKL